jgi:hypothetical protein
MVSYLEQAGQCLAAAGSKGATLPALKQFVAAARGAGYVNGTFLLQLRNAVKAGKLTLTKGTYKVAKGTNQKLDKAANKADHSHAGLAYTVVCREWRCSFKEWPATRDGGEETSRIVKDLCEAFSAVEAQLKATDGVTKVQQLMCSTCCDYKILVSVDADAWHAWKDEACQPEAQFLASVQAVQGVDTGSATAQLYSIHELS